MSTSTTTSTERSVSRSVTCRLPGGADRPVDRSQLVAGDVGADVGILHAGAGVAGQVGAQPLGHLGPGNRGGGAGAIGKTNTSATSAAATALSSPPGATTARWACSG